MSVDTQEPNVETTTLVDAAGVNLASISAAGAIKMDGSAVTQPISAASLPLPSGAATAAGITTLDVDLGIINANLTNGNATVKQTGTWTVQPGNTANTTAWKVDGSAVTQPIVNTTSIYATYGAQIVGLVPAAATTDLFTITGSATKTIVVTKIRFGATTTLGSTKDIVLLKRSTANSAGTSTSPAVVPFDSADPAGTAVVRAYTANPTLGTVIGAFKAYKFQISAVGTANQDLQMEFDPFTTKGVVLRGTSQVLAVSGNGVAFAAGASIDISIEWIEL